MVTDTDTEMETVRVNRPLEYESVPESVSRNVKGP